MSRVSSVHSPHQSLDRGTWFKLICGASFQELPTIRNLALVYTLAGADCIDMAADGAVITAVRTGIEQGLTLAKQQHRPVTKPWVMVSFNDGEDPHFRKAHFDPDRCPPDCPRPCAQVCPTHAISFTDNTGVKTDSCYGCGRCLSLCPLNLITEQFHQPSPQTIQPLVEEGYIDAIEIHTQIGHQDQFAQLWPQFHPWLDYLKLLAISCQDGPGLLAYLKQLKAIVEPMNPILLWQTDGRPMSGDLGQGTIHRAIAMGQKVASSDLGDYVQLAGGTNNFTIDKLRSMVNPPDISGIAYGGYARSLLNPIFSQMADPADPIEKYPLLLGQAQKAAQKLVNQIKIF